MKHYCNNGKDEIKVGGVYVFRNCYETRVIACEEIDGDHVFCGSTCYTIDLIAHELPRDSDGYYLWEGGECPVPEDWAVEGEYRTGEYATDPAILFKWNELKRFRVVSTGEEVKPTSKLGWETVPEVPYTGEGLEFNEEASMAEKWRNIEHKLEQDPNGKDPHESGAKLDAGKNRLGLVIGSFARALSKVGEVGTYGANKYTDNGWLDVPNGEARYTDALYRHLFSEAKGEVNDKDTDLPHAAHAAWNALARLELALIEEERKGVK